ncbi:MAG: glycosyltransferase [Candidatus Pacebacteria bacterium]|nr:glycosyltransferase [Candidatus Paceibacterota bacterium]
MKISVITPTYNSEQTIEDTLKSVCDQEFKNFEHIIVDNESSDNTLKIVDKYKRKSNLMVISEKDNGLYHAMNKGVKLASGDIIGIINSDDFYSSREVFSLISDIFNLKNDVQGVYGDLVYISKKNKDKIVRYWRSGEFKEKKLKYGWIMPHPTVFLRRDVYNSFDKPFREDLSLAADYEFLLRLLKIRKINFFYIKEVLVKMREGGLSNSSLKQRIEGWKQLKKSWQINNFKIPKFFIFRRVFAKLGQLFFVYLFVLKMFL